MPTGRRAPRATGFTLLELIVVLAVMAVLVSLSWPAYIGWLDRSKAAVLRENLKTTRRIIDAFHEDTGRYPAALEELVSRGYLKALPIDPITERTDTWLINPPRPGEQGVVRDLRSGAPGVDGEARPWAAY
jgi:general secretion pathway protein G